MMIKEVLAKERKSLGKSRRWVIKIGSALATNNGLGLNTDKTKDWASQISELLKANRQIVIVASVPRTLSLELNVPID